MKNTKKSKTRKTQVKNLAPRKPVKGGSRVVRTSSTRVDVAGMTSGD